MSAAAEQAGLAMAAFLGQAGLDAAEHRAVPVPVWQQELLRELARASQLVRGAGANLARLNAGDEPGRDLEPAVAYCMRGHPARRRGSPAHQQAAAVIGRVLARGSNLAGLLYYLYGPGKACEHVNPHLVAGW